MTLFFILIGVYALGCMSGYGFWSIFQYDNDEHTRSPYSPLTIYHQRSRN